MNFQPIPFVSEPQTTFTPTFFNCFHFFKQTCISIIGNHLWDHSDAESCCWIIVVCFLLLSFDELQHPECSSYTSSPALPNLSCRLSTWDTFRENCFNLVSISLNKLESGYRFGLCWIYSHFLCISFAFRRWITWERPQTKRCTVLPLSYPSLRYIWNLFEGNQMHDKKIKIKHLELVRLKFVFRKSQTWTLVCLHEKVLLYLCWACGGVYWGLNEL